MMSKIPREKDIFNDISFSVGNDFLSQQNNRQRNMLANKDLCLKEFNKFNMNQEVGRSPSKEDISINCVQKSKAKYKENAEISHLNSNINYQPCNNQSPKPKANMFKFHPDSIKPNDNSKGSEPRHETSISSNQDLNDFE